MSARVILHVLEGDFRGKEYEFTNHTLCTVGRSSSCLLQLPDDGSDRTVSRRHCMFDIDPPEVQLIDLGSLNGTCVNGERIGGRTGCVAGGPGAGVSCVVPYPLHDGDEVRIGQTLLCVEVGERDPSLTAVQDARPHQEEDAYAACI
jgi:serine/threonine-protein kinase